MQDRLFRLTDQQQNDTKDGIQESEARAILCRPEDQYTAVGYTDFVFDWMEGLVKKEDDAVQAFGTLEQVKKRKKAVRENIDKYLERFSDIRLWSPTDTFLMMEYGRYISYEEMDLDYHYILAAALWLLDELYMSDQLREVHDYLPESSYDITNEWTPQDFYHPCYSNDLIRSVAQIIGDDRYEDQFRELLSLLPEERIEGAVNKFKDLHEKAIEAYMRGQAVLDRSKLRIIAELKMLPFDRQRCPAENVPARPEDYMKEWAELSSELQKNHEEKKDFQCDFWSYFGSRKEHIMQRGKLAKLMNAEIEDPYEICFALAFLRFDDDPSTWLESSGCAALHAACRMLPWYDSPEDDYYESSIDYADGGWLEQEQPKEKTDLYHQFDKDGMNAAQRIYQLSKGIVPLGKHPFEKQRKQMAADGIYQADYIADQAELLFLSNTRLDAVNFLFEDMDEEEIEDGITGHAIESGPVDMPDDPADSSEDKTEELRRKLDDLQKQNKSLRAAMAESRKAYRAEQEAAQKELKIARMEHRELADLRELIFNQENEPAEKDAVTSGPGIEFPYTPRLRTVVFGGHDTFLKEFRKRLPDVPCVSTKIFSFDPGLVRNADVVWIQSNCISHSQYWKILRTTRTHGVQVRYFGYVSAEKCALQLAEEDQKARKK